MLIYHPAYDAFHCVFRLLSLIANTKRLEISKVRILDFFLTFPAEVKTIRLPPALSTKKKLAANLTNIYHGPLNSQQVFRDMEHIQIAALNALAGSNIIDRDLLKKGYVERTSVTLPDDLQLRIDEKNSLDEPISKFIFKELSEMPLFGIDGLKHRTGLMEYRYDNV